MAITLSSNYWYGKKASEYGIENGYLDYGTFAAAFPHILNNDIMSTAAAHDLYFEIYCGDEYDEETETHADIYQFYIVPEWSVKEILADAGEIVFYCEELDVYLWGVTHYGTHWDYVLTNIKLNQEEK